MSYIIPENIKVTTLSASSGITGSFSGSGALINNIGTSNWVGGSSGFTADVRSQFSAGTGIDITDGSISATGTGGSGGSSSDILITAKNESGGTLNKAVVVHITASSNSSDTPSITKADWTSDSLSANTLGLTYSSILLNQTGSVITEGILTGVDISHLSSPESGQILYLSSSGGFTNIKPVAPKHTVTIGQLVRSSPTNNATIYVVVKNGYELGELHDVLINGTSNGDLLVKDNGLWKNSKVLSGSYQITNNLTASIINVTSISSSNGFNASGSSIIDVSSTNAALRVTQRGAGNSILVEDSPNPDANPFVVDTIGRVGVGTVTPSASLHIAGNLLHGNFPSFSTLGNGSHAQGDNTKAIGNYAHAEGSGSIAWQSWSHAEGAETVTSGGYSHAEGQRSTTYGGYSHAEGYDTETIGQFSHAEGQQTIASGNYSHAEGDKTIALGQWSHTEGENCVASGSYSHAEGRFTIAEGNYQHVMGKFNKPNASALVLVGNGVTDSLANRKNILEIYDDRVIISGTLQVTTDIIGERPGFSPIKVASADLTTTAATTQYYYQTVAETTFTISKMKIWGASGSGFVRAGIYRGKLGTAALAECVLIGQGRETCNVGPNEIIITPEAGQNLSVVAGEDIVVGIYSEGTSWTTVYDNGISDIAFGRTDTTDITTMPITPDGSATPIRFACTLY